MNQAPGIFPRARDALSPALWAGLALAFVIALAACTGKPKPTNDVGPPSSGVVDSSVKLPDTELNLLKSTRQIVRDGEPVSVTASFNVTTLKKIAPWLPPSALRRVLLKQGDTLEYKLVLSTFGLNATGAQFSVRACAAAGTGACSPVSGWTLPSKKATSTLSTDFLAINQSAWTSANFQLWGWGTNGSKVSRDSALIAAWSVQRSPGPPVGGVDSSGTIAGLRVLPDSVELMTASAACTAASPGTDADGRPLAVCRGTDGKPMVQTFCAVVMFKDQSATLADGSPPICDSLFQAVIPAAKRATAPWKQATATAVRYWTREPNCSIESRQAVYTKAPPSLPYTVCDRSAGPRQVMIAGGIPERGGCAKLTGVNRGRYGCFSTSRNVVDVAVIK